MIRQCAFTSASSDDDLSNEDEAKAEKTRFFSLERLLKFFQSINEKDFEKRQNITYALECPCFQCMTWKYKHPPEGRLDDILRDLQDEKVTRFFAALIYLNHPQLVYPLYASNDTDGKAVDANTMKELRQKVKKTGLLVPGRHFCDALKDVSYWFEPYRFESRTTRAANINLDMSKSRLPFIFDKNKHSNIDVYLVRGEHVEKKLRNELEADYPDAVQRSADGKQVWDFQSAPHKQSPAGTNIVSLYSLRTDPEVPLCSQACPCDGSYGADFTESPSTTMPERSVPHPRQHHPLHSHI